jgi:hypothetical protein
MPLSYHLAGRQITPVPSRQQHQRQLRAIEVLADRFVLAAHPKRAARGTSALAEWWRAFQPENTMRNSTVCRPRLQSLLTMAAAKKGATRLTKRGVFFVFESPHQASHATRIPLSSSRRSWISAIAGPSDIAGNQWPLALIGTATSRR